MKTLNLSKAAKHTTDISNSFKEIEIAAKLATPIFLKLSQDLKILKHFKTYKK